MEKKQNVPALRFQGFSGEWESHYLGMLGVTFSGLSGKTKADFGHGQAKFVPYLNVFNHPVADLQETEAIEIDDKQNEVKYGDIFFTTSSETPEEVGMSSVWLGNEKNVYLNSFCFGYRPTSTLYPFFMAFLLRSSSVRKEFVFLAQGISRYNISKNKAMGIGISVPLFREQCKIGDFFQNLDKLIDGQSHKIQKLQQFRQAMLAKLFPREGAAEPELRFRGFSGKWKSCCLTDIATINPPSELPETFNYVDLESVIGTEIVKYRRETKFSAPSRAQRVAEDNDVFYQMVRPYQKNNCIFRGNDKTFVFSTGYAQLRPNCNSYFLLSLLQTEYFVGKVMELCTGTSFPAISASDLARIPIYVPVMSEENGAIGEYFQNLDSYISLQQKKLERMQRLKAALLEKLFV